MSDSVTPWTVACEAPLSRGFFRQGYWSGLPFPSPGNLSSPGIKPTPPASAGRFRTAEPRGYIYIYTILTYKCFNSQKKERRKEATRKRQKRREVVPFDVKVRWEQATTADPALSPTQEPAASCSFQSPERSLFSSSQGGAHQNAGAPSS